MIYQQTIDKNAMFLHEYPPKNSRSLRSLVIIYKKCQASSLTTKVMIILRVTNKCNFD